MKKLLLLFVMLPLLLSPTQASTKTEVMKASKQAVLALKSKNMAKLAALVHPAKGVRFTAYSYVDKKVDLVFKAGQVSGLWKNRKIYNWGAYDGSDEPIKLRFSKYYAAFIYDRDFANAPQIEYNTLIGHGNTPANFETVYTKAKFVEYHFPDSGNGGAIDWKSLRLIFEKSGRKWYLVGICHDEWTI
jgi:hypothetical protein